MFVSDHPSCMLYQMHDRNYENTVPRLGIDGAFGKRKDISFPASSLGVGYSTRICVAWVSGLPKGLASIFPLFPQKRLILRLKFGVGEPLRVGNHTLFRTEKCQNTYALFRTHTLTYITLFRTKCRPSSMFSAIYWQLK